MISTFGPKAAAYAPRLGDIEAIVTDPDLTGHAYREAVRRRELGQSFYGLVLFDDPRVAFGYNFGEQILAQFTDYDQRRWVAEKLSSGELPVNGQRADAMWAPPVAVEQVSVEFLWLCDAFLVRSWAEFERVAAMFGRHPNPRPLHPVERILAATSVPVVQRVRPERPSVVVWAPERGAHEFALALHGLAEFHGDITCVAAGGKPPTWPAGARFLTAADPRLVPALAQSSAVICLDPSDPGAAVEFARQGYGVVAPITSGAHEFACEVVPWDAADAGFLFTALAIAIARPAGVLADPPEPPREPYDAGRPAVARPGAELPLVTIITPTYNRREQLREMLKCVAAQTYPNIESVVVNDGGIAIDDIVAQFPFARLIDKPQNAGTARAQLTGWENARGEYIALLPDDDWLYPDHIERLVGAMLRSGAKVAHGGALLRYLERLGDEAWFTVGFNATVFSQTLQESDALISSTIGGHQMLVHRSVYEEAGWYDLDSDVSDNELHARFTKRWFYAFPDHVTCEFRDHAGSQGRKIDFRAAMRDMFENKHPVTNRPTLEQIRALTLDNVGKREPGQSPFPRTLRIDR